MMETENIEEVITTHQQDQDEESYSLSTTSFTEDDTGENEMTQQFLSVQDSIFNPATGTLQPISSVMAATTQSSAKQKKSSKQQTVKKSFFSFLMRIILFST